MNETKMVCRRLIASVLAGALLIGPTIALAPTGGASHVDDLPTLRKWKGDEGDSWGFTIKSDSEITTPRGNPFAVDVVAGGPATTQAVSVGIYLMDPSDPAGDARKGAIFGMFYNEDRVLVEPVGDFDDPSQLPEVEVRRSGDDVLFNVRYEPYLEAHEELPLLIWVAGVSYSEVTVRGQGGEVTNVTRGEGHSLSNQAILNDGIRVRQGVEPPQGAGSGSIGAGASLVQNASYSFTAEDPAIGIWDYWEAFKGACLTLDSEVIIPGVGSGKCGFAGPYDSHVQYGCGVALAPVLPPGAPGDCEGVYKISWRGPDMNDSVVASHGISFFPGADPGAEDGFVPPKSGTQTFIVDRFVDASGPIYHAPVTGTGPFMGETYLWLTFAEIDLTPLAG